MKKISLMISVIAVLTIALIGNMSFAATEAPVLKTTLLRYDPTPAQPGDYIQVYVQIENIGGSATSKARLEFIDSFPFSMENEKEKTIDIGVLGIGQTFITDFKIRVSSDAIEGANELKFHITNNYLIDLGTDKVFYVNVLTQDADVDITDIDITPNELNPGEKGTIRITLKNAADSGLEDISLTLLTVNTHGSAITDLPFAIEDSISKKTTERLRSKQEVVYEYPIITYPTVAPGIYKLPIILEFYDGTGTQHNKSDLITLIVNPKVNIFATIDRSDLTKDIRSGEIVIRIVNRGFGEIKFLNLELLESEDYELISPFSETYIGNIDSDDYETAEFNIIAKENAVNIPIKLQFRDSLNKEYSMQQDLTLNLYSPSELGQGKSYKGTFFIGLVMVLVIGYWFYRRKKKKK